MTAQLWRSGDRNERHAIERPRDWYAACGARVLPERSDRSDQPRCADCLAAVGITVPAPAIPESESELRFAHGDR